MATVNEVLADSFGRIGGTVHRVVGSLTDGELTARVAPGANTVAWLVWHLTRVIDAQVAGAMGDDEVWTGGGWMERFGLPFTATATGYGQTSDEVGAVRASPELLLGYLDEVQVYVATVVERLTGDDLDRIVDRRWDPPVTLAVRLVSIIDDAAQHAGQAAYAAGILQMRR